MPFLRLRFQNDLTSTLRYFWQPKLLCHVLLGSLGIQTLGLVLPAVTAIVIDKVIPQRSYDRLVEIGCVVVVLTAVQMLLRYFRAKAIATLTARIDRSMLLGFLDHLLALPMSFFLATTTGDVLSRMNSNSVIRGIVSGQLTAVLVDGLLVIGYLVALLVYEPILGVLVVLLGLTQGMMLLRALGAMNRYAIWETAAQAESQGFLIQVVKGIAALKAAMAEQHAFQHWVGLFNAQARASMARQSEIERLSSVVQTIMWASSPVVIVVGGSFVLRGRMSLGEMLGFSALAAAFLAPFTSMIQSAQGIQSAHAHLERINEVLRAPSSRPRNYPQGSLTLEGRIELVGVDFRYGPNLRQAIRQATIAILPGQMVALVGRSGAGKSTLGFLLTGLHRPTNGKVLYDGHELETIDPKALREQVGVILQDTFVFRDTVARNVSLYDPSVTMPMIVRASDLAELSGDVMGLQAGFDTLLAEGGGNVSGGQKQRIGIARALVHSPRVLLMDEATSQLDGITESRIQRNLDGLGMTRVVISHRLSTIEKADNVVLLENAYVTDYGRHEELLARNKHYAQLLASQVSTA